MLGSGLIWRLLGLLFLVEILLSPESARGTPTLDISGILRLDAHFVQLRFCLARSWVIVGFSLILWLGRGLLLRDGLLGSLSLAGLLLFGLLPGFTRLINLGL